MKVTNRTRKIELRISTDPALVGYAGSEEKTREAVERFRASEPWEVGTAKAVLVEAFKFRQLCGPATFKRIEFSYKGEILDERELNIIAGF